MAGLSLYLFGSYQIMWDGKALSHPLPAKSRALLAFLAVEKHALPREKIAGLLWPDHSEAQAHHNLSQALYGLRRVFELPAGEPALLLIDSQKVQLNPQVEHWVDVLEFTSLLQACDHHSHPQLSNCPECFDRLQQAAMLYRGSFLADYSLKDTIPFEEWCTVQRERLHRQAIQVLLYQADYLEGRGKIEQALEVAWRQVEFDPLSEVAHRQVIHLLAESGRRSEALAQFNTLEFLLKDALQVTPDAGTLELIKRIQNQKPQVVEMGKPAPHQHETRMPASLITMVGREAELTELKDLLKDTTCRLVTIFGPGGVGKTRLAVELGHWTANDFADGVYFISLSAQQAGNPLWPLLAEAVHLPLRQNQDLAQQVLDYLSDKRILLILDSFETVLEQAAWLADLLQRAPRLTTLVTSRAQLKISAERVFPLTGMHVPEDGAMENLAMYSAVQLLLSFIRRRQPAFALDGDNQMAAVRICQLVQGLPLGLLLASSWVDYYSLEEIALEIEHSLDFLETDWSDVPLRQRSLRATFDYSWRQLSTEEQRLLTALAVFAGGFDLAAVQPVTGQPVRLLRSLVDKCLVNRARGGRYHIHDLVRQYAAELFESTPKFAEAVHHQHSRFYLQALSNWEADLKGMGQREALEAMDQEVENLRIAWRWAVANHDLQGIAQGLEGMAWYAELRLRFQDGERACRTVLEQISLPSYDHLVSALICWKAHFLRRLGQAEEARQELQAELDRLAVMRLAGYQADSEQALVLYELGELYMYTDRESAKPCYQQSLELYDRLGDMRGQALVLASLGEAYHHTGPLDQAQVYLDRGVAICRRMGDPRLLARCILWSGWNHLRQGKILEAEDLILESIEINRLLGDRYSEAFWSAELGTVHGWMGRLRESCDLLSKSIPLYQELGLKQEATLSILRRGLMELNLQENQAALQDFQDCLAASYKLKYQRGIGLGIYGIGCVALNEGNFQKAEELFLQALPILQSAQADEAGWCLGLLTFTMVRSGQSERGWQYARQGLDLGIQAKVYHSIAITMQAIALLLLDADQVERAIEIHALTLRYPLIEKSPWFSAFCGRYVDEAAAHLPPEVSEAARQHGRERELFSTAQELLENIPVDQVTAS